MVGQLAQVSCPPRATQPPKPLGDSKMARKSSKNTQDRLTLGQFLADTWTVLLALVVALIALAENAWAGSRMLMQAGQAWYEGVGLVGTLDAMMVISAVRMRRKGISPTQIKISRVAMWYGLGMSACTNVLSALVYKGIVDVSQAGPWIVVAYSPVAVVTLWFVVEMLTHQGNSKKESAFPLVKAAKPKADSDLTPAELAKREHGRYLRRVAKYAKDHGVTRADARIALELEAMESQVNA